MNRYLSSLLTVRWLWLLMLSGLLAACGGEGDSFLDKNIDAGPQAKTIISTELVIGGRVDGISLTPGQETSIAVRVIYEDGSHMYLEPSDVTFEYSLNQPMVVRSSASTDAPSDDVEHAPFVIDGFLLTVPSNMNENVGVTAVYKDTRTQTVLVEVHDKVIDQLQLTPATQTLAKGHDAQLTLTATYADKSTAEIAPSVVAWSVESGEGVTISGGLVTATEANKTAVIKAVYQGQSATASITTSAATMDSITLLDATTDEPLVSLVLPLNTTHTMKVEATLSDGSTQALPSGVTYLSSDDKVATVASDGVITALQGGESIISATYTVGERTFISNATIINVSGASVKSIAIVPDFNPTAYRIAGLEYDLDVQATLTDDTVVNITSMVTWQPENADIASIINSSRGTLEAKKGGETDISAHYASFSDTLTVKVIDARLTSLEVTPGAQSLNVDSTKQYQAIAHYNNGVAVDVTDQVSWSTSPPSIATIDTNTGLATAISAGPATITAAKGSTTTSVPLTVTDKPVESIQISANSTSLPEGQSTLLTAVVTYKDGTQEIDRSQDVLWVSSEPLHGAVKNGYFYAFTKGETELKATFRGEESNVITMEATDATLSGLTLIPTTTDVAAGQTQHYVLMGTYTNTQEYDVTSQATWAVTAKDGTATTIASMTTKGEVNTTAPGEVKVIATIGTLSTQADLTITNKRIDQVVLNYGQDIVLNKGDTANPDVRLVYSDNTFSETLASTDSNLSFHTANTTPTIAEFDNTVKGQLNTLNENKTQAWVTYQSGAETLNSDKVDVIVTGKAVRSIAFTEEVSDLPKGTEGRFVLEATYTDGTKAIVTENAAWTSSVMEKATVLKGTVSASKTNTGNTTITANYEGESITHTVTVTEATLTHVTLDVNSLQLHQGLTQDLILTAHYSDDSTQDQTSTATWTPANGTFASVSQGTVKGRAEGQTKITASLGGKTASADVFVVERAVDRIEIEVGAMSINKGATTSFKVFAYYEDALNTPVDVTYHSVENADRSVVHVMSDMVYGIDVGTASLFAEYKGKVDTLNGFEVTNKAVASLQLDPATQSLPKGDSSTYTLTAVYTDKTTAVIDNALATWSIEADSNTGVAPTSVSINEGSVKAEENSGIATVKVSYQNVETTAVVTPTNATLESIVLIDVSTGAPLKPVTLHDGQGMYYLAVYGLYSDGSSKALTTGVTYKVDGDAISVDNIGGWGMHVNSRRSSEASSVYAEYAQPGGPVWDTSKVPVTVTSAQVASLNIVPNFDATQDLMKGASYTFKAMATLSNTASVDVTSLVSWQSNNNAIGEMSSVTKGQLDTKDDGGITITASYGTYSDAIAVNVADVTLQSIVVTPANYSIDVGDHQRYQAMGHYNNSDTLDITNQVNWSVSDATKATVNRQGDVTTVAPGTITVHASKDGVDGETDLTIRALDEVTSVHIELQQAHSLAVGESAPLNAQIYFKNSVNNDYDAAKRVTWTVEDPSIGYIIDGVWHARAQGDTKVWATFGGMTSNEQFAHVNVAAVVSLTIDPSTAIEVAEGDTHQLKAEATYSNSDTLVQPSSVHWSSNNPKVTVDGTGLITAANDGNGEIATITASLGGKSATTTVTVQAAERDKLVLNHPSIVFAKGERITLSAHWLHTNLTTDPIDFTDAQYVIKVDDTSVVSIDNSNGTQLKADEEGLTVIWLEYTDGTTTTKSEKVQVWVKSVQTTNLKLVVSPDELPVGAQDQRFVLIATNSEDVHFDVTASAHWSSNNENVATVDAGLITAKTDGTVVIDAAFDGLSVSHTLRIIESHSSTGYYTLTPNLVNMHMGSKEQLQVSAIDHSTGSAVTTYLPNSRLDWESDDESVVEVNSTGLVTAKSEGRTSITVTIDGIDELKAAVNVTDAKVIDITISPAPVNLPQGSPQQMTAHAVYDRGLPQDITTNVIWSVGEDTVASINPSTGLLKGILTDDSNSATTVTATWTDHLGKTHTKSTDVTVTKAKLVGLLLQPDEINLNIGDTDKLLVIGVYEDTSTSDISGQVDWEISDANKVYISKDEALNTATIGSRDYGNVTVKAKADTASGSVVSNEISVKVRQMTGLKILPKEGAAVNSLAKGTSMQLEAWAQYNGGTEWEKVDSYLVWSSSAPASLSVDYLGYVTGHLNHVDERIITVEDLVDGNLATLNLRVTEAEPVSMYITNTTSSTNPDFVTIKATDERQLYVRYNMTDGSTSFADPADLTWSEESGIGTHVTITSDGKIRGVLEGETTVKVESTSSNLIANSESEATKRVLVEHKLVTVGTPVTSHLEGDYSDYISVASFQLHGVTNPDVSLLKEHNLGAEYKVAFTENTNGTYTMRVAKPPRRLANSYQWSVNAGSNANSSTSNTIVGSVSVTQSSFELKTDGSLLVNGVSIPDGHTLSDGSSVELTRSSNSEADRRREGSSGPICSWKSLNIDEFKLRGQSWERKDAFGSWVNRSYFNYGDFSRERTESYTTSYSLNRQTGVYPFRTYFWDAKTVGTVTFSLKCADSPLHQPTSVSVTATKDLLEAFSNNSMNVPADDSTNAAGVSLPTTNSTTLGVQRYVSSGSSLTGYLNFY